MSQCARPGCIVKGKCKCSGCGWEQYCGTVCQKMDWKLHKNMCPMLKRLSMKLQPFNEVDRILIEIFHTKKERDTRVLEHLLSYAEFQFGKRLPGIDYRERKDGERISNLTEEIAHFYYINRTISDIYSNDGSLGLMVRDNKMYPYLEKMLDILSPWLIHLSPDASNRINGLDGEGIDNLLYESTKTEGQMAWATLRRNQYDITEGHCERCLAYSKRLIEGERKTSVIFSNFTLLIELRCRQRNYSSAVNVAEEAYNFVVVAYDPVHPLVQQAAGTLISCLVRKGDLVNAERFAEQTYANLTDVKHGIDQKSSAVGDGTYDLADVIYRLDGNLVKAEELARKALHIRVHMHEPQSDHDVGVSCTLLANILQKQGVLGVETKGLYERSLAIMIRNGGPDGCDTALANNYLGAFYHKLSGVQSTYKAKR